MKNRAQRLALNEAAFRSLNERLAVTPRRPDDSDLTPFACECSDLGCRQQVYLRGGEYETVRSDSRWFLVAVGQAEPAIERVVRHTLRYDVVEKYEAVRPIVEETDPRRR